MPRLLTIRPFKYIIPCLSVTATTPFRMMWYQTGPYFAYYYAGRYQDVINLANVNKTIAQPTLEESLYWRGMAEAAPVRPKPPSTIIAPRWSFIRTIHLRFKDCKHWECSSLVVG